MRGVKPPLLNMPLLYAAVFKAWATECYSLESSGQSAVFAHGRNIWVCNGVAKICELLQTSSSIANGQVYTFRLGFYCVLRRRRIEGAGGTAWHWHIVGRLYVG